jgi:AraC-like DNA-binding protein
MNDAPEENLYCKPAVPLVLGAFAQPLIGMLKEIGVPLDRYFRQFFIPCELEITPTVLIPEAPWWGLSEKIAAVEGIPDFGLRIMDRVPLFEISDAAPELENCVNLYDVIKTFCRNIRFQSTNSQFSLIKIGNITYFADLTRSLQPGGGFQISQHHLLDMIQLIQMVLGKEWRPKIIYFCGPYNHAIKMSSVLAPDCIHFNAPFTAISLSRSELAKHCKNNTNKKNSAGLKLPPHDFVSNLLEVLTFQMQGRKCTISELSEISNLSVRTLQRRLTETGISFSQLYVLAKLESAKQMLDDNTRTVSEISDRLGYSDYTKFSRAFKKSAGVTPKDYRKLRLEY